MAKFRIGDGCDRYCVYLNRLEKDTDKIIGKAIYEGAKIVTDEIRVGINDIPIGEGSWGKSGMVTTITKSQSDGLKEGLGIARKQNQNGYINVKVGMDGYNRTITQKYNWGQPNAMIARSVESGTSFRQKHPFIAPAVQKTKAAAEAAMQKELENQIKQRTL